MVELHCRLSTRDWVVHSGGEINQKIVGEMMYMSLHITNVSSSTPRHRTSEIVTITLEA